MYLPFMHVAVFPRALSSGRMKHPYIEYHSTTDCSNNFTGGSWHKVCAEAGKHYCEQSYNKDRGRPIKSR